MTMTSNALQMVRLVGHDVQDAETRILLAVLLLTESVGDIGQVQPLVDAAFALALRLPHERGIALSRALSWLEPKGDRPEDGARIRMANRLVTSWVLGVQQ